MTYFGSRAPKEGEVFDRRGRRKYLDSSERRTLLRAIKRERDALRRAFVLTLFYTGCRISEALNVTKERLDETAGSITHAGRIARVGRTAKLQINLMAITNPLTSRITNAVSHSPRRFSISARITSP